MRTLSILSLLLLLSLLLPACSDPRDAADADAIRLQAQAEALQQAQEREQQQELFEIEKAERQAISATLVNARAQIIDIGVVVVSISLGIAMLSTALGVGLAALGIGTALMRAANLKANLIQLNPETRQFPLILQYAGKGRYTLTNPNTGSVAFLDTRRDEDRQLISTSGAVQIAGAIAAEARKSKDPASVAIIRPPIISPTGESKDG